jgi:hypothetical protein
MTRNTVEDIVEFSVTFDGQAWRLNDEAGVCAVFDNPHAAERRGRWYAARASVGGQTSQLFVHDAAGVRLGVWRNEAFEPALADPLALAA